MGCGGRSIPLSTRSSHIPTAPPPPPEVTGGSTTRIVRMVFPDQTNHHDTLFGGEALSLMASAGSISAARHSRRPVVLAGSHAIDFRAPVPHGSIAEVTARVTAIGRTSMVVTTTLDAEDLLTGKRTRSTEGRFTFVAVDDDQRPTPVIDREIGVEILPDPELTVTTERVLPGQVNHLGTLFGGEMVRLADVVAFIAAARHTRKQMVTARFEDLDLVAPIGLGDLVEVSARVIETRRTSLVVGVDVVGEDPRTGDRYLATSGRVVMAPARRRPDPDQREPTG